MDTTDDIKEEAGKLYSTKVESSMKSKETSCTPAERFRICFCRLIMMGS